MKFRLPAINIYLCCCLAALLAAGCQSPEAGKEKKAAEKKGDKKLEAMVRLYQQVNPDGSGSNAPVSVYRAKPVEINVSRMPFLDETSLKRAGIVEDGFGTFAIGLEFDRRGTLILENLTAVNVNSHIAIQAVFGPKLEQVRWLAAPYLRQRITNGVVIFTPDATREEAEQLVTGLNNVIERVAKKDLLRERE
ncbi:MAG: hypothetical protein AB1705_19910 [Verrucomicrobiota bacterium]